MLILRQTYFILSFSTLALYPFSFLFSPFVSFSAFLFFPLKLHMQGICYIQNRRIFIADTLSSFQVCVLYSLLYIIVFILFFCIYVIKSDLGYLHNFHFPTFKLLVFIQEKILFLFFPVICSCRCFSQDSCHQHQRNKEVEKFKALVSCLLSSQLIAFGYVSWKI